MVPAEFPLSPVRDSTDHQTMDPDIYQISTKAPAPTGKLPAKRRAK
jgi:hypothetical protein